MATSSDQRQRRTQSERRDAARTAILDTAVKLLANGGYASMTLADLGERAGYSRSLATHYFGSKPKLLAAVIDYVLTDSPPVTLDADAPGIERIEAEIAGFFDGLTANPSWARAYIVIAHEAATCLGELQPAIHRQNLAFRERIQSALHDAIGAGTVHPDLDPVSVSIAVVAMVRGIAWEWFTDRSFDLSACRRALLSQTRALFTSRNSG